MNGTFLVIGLILSVALFAYLVYVMIKPEKF
jgi:K+-transporting ATPase KdpF subunit